MNVSIAHGKALGGACIITGLLIRYLIGRRRFNRRGVGGLQQFRNYELALIITFLENLFSKIAYALLLAGAYLLWNDYH